MMPVTERYQRMRIDQFGKDLATGSYDLVMLDILNRKPAYAYGIVREIFEKSKGTTRWHEGTVYHVLHHLEKQGLRDRVRARPQKRAANANTTVYRTRAPTPGRPGGSNGNDSAAT